jgi:hypothetical protein
MRHRGRAQSLVHTQQLSLRFANTGKDEDRGELTLLWRLVRDSAGLEIPQDMLAARLIANCHIPREIRSNNFQQ